MPSACMKMCAGFADQLSARAETFSRNPGSEACKVWSEKTSYHIPHGCVRTSPCLFNSSKDRAAAQHVMATRVCVLGVPGREASCAAGGGMCCCHVCLAAVRRAGSGEQSVGCDTCVWMSHSSSPLWKMKIATFFP